ncbi:GNAT family N-acetyltransferase [Actinomadura logoneensis]|uniref:GNAT family N-acetyltransferase n=2 Tax=Actinomadura logoneensis TaxID=2293572 RepID=A0A372JD53_9ACTN|nr:GNAT family N-acetyltransferase [Actinomadura logoneensis]
MTTDDLPAAQQVFAAAFLEVDRLGRRWNDPEPEPQGADAARTWLARMDHLLAADPAGCVVAEEDGGLVGFAVSQNRGGVWYLAVYAVQPGIQSKGVGKRLLDAVLDHADGRPGIFSASAHPGATRRYRLAGFTLHPMMRMVGRVERSALPVVQGLRDGRPDDLEWMDALDGRLRGGGHGPDHRYLLENARLIVSAAPDRRPGYVYLDEALGRPVLLAADDPGTAGNLLWDALAHTRGETLVDSITVANDWAVDVGLAARLDLDQKGYLALRGMSEPAPYLADGYVL